MNNVLFADASFQKGAGVLAANENVRRGIAELDREALAARLNEFDTHLTAYGATRRRAARLHRLSIAGRPIEPLNETITSGTELPQALLSFASAAEKIREALTHLQPVLHPDLDNLLALHQNDGHPLREGLQRQAAGWNFAPEELNWCFGEYAATGNQPLQTMMGDEFEDLLAITHGASTGEHGILQCGFMRLTGNAEMDERIERVVLRCREAGMTASLYHLIPVVLTASHVADYHVSRMDKAVQ